MPFTPALVTNDFWPTYFSGSGAVVKGRLVVFHRVGQRAGVAGIERNVRDEAVRDRACHPGRAVHFVRRDSAPLLPWRKEVSRPMAERAY